MKEEPEPVAPEPSEVPRTKQLKRGPKSKYQWETFTHEVTRRAALDGLPDTLADAERMMAEWCENQWGEQPAPSMIREKLSPLYRYLRDQGYIKS